MRIDLSSPVPIFTQVADGVRHALAARVYEPGEPIPSIRALAVKLKINPNTIKRAYEELEREGLIESRKGLGMFVTRRGEGAARAQTVDSVRSAFAEGIRMGSAAELGRPQIDAEYTRAWTDAEGTKGAKR